MPEINIINQLYFIFLKKCCNIKVHVLHTKFCVNIGFLFPWMCTSRVAGAEQGRALLPRCPEPHLALPLRPAVGGFPRASAPQRFKVDKCLEMKAPSQVPGDFRRGRAYSELTNLEACN